MKLKLTTDNLSEIKKNPFFYIAILLSFLTTLLLFLHPSNLSSFNDVGYLKWIIIIFGIMGMSGLVLFGIFGYLLLIFYTISSIKEKLKQNRILSTFGTVFQFLLIVSMTWPIPMLVIRPIAKLYFNLSIPDLY